LSCSLSGISSNTLLAPGEQKTFSLNIESTASSGSFVIPLEVRAGPSEPSCTTSLTLTANVVSSQSGSVQSLTSWITPTDSQNARPSDSVEYTIGLKNNLDKKIFASISSQSTNPFESSTTLSASNVALEGGETKYVYVTVRLPPGTPGGTYQWIYNVDAGNCCNNLDLPVSITVDGSPLNVQLRGSPVQTQCTAVRAGSSVSIPMSLFNNGDVTGPFDLSIQGSSNVKNIASVTEPRLTVLNGEEKPFQVQISPSSHTAIDTYTYKLRGTYNGFIFLDKNFCFSVQGVQSASISAPSNIVIERTRLTNTQVNLTNIGTTTDTYALSVAPTEDVTVLMQPSSFTLTPGQTQVVSVAISSDLSTPLGERTLSLRLDADNYSRNIDLNATVYATGRRGESLLRVTAPTELTFVKGITKSFEVTIENIGTNVLRDVYLTLAGVNQEWYTADNRTLLPGGSEVFTITLTIPESYSAQQLDVNLTATSSGEVISEPITFTATNVVFDFTVLEITENRQANGETTSVDLITIVTNNGASPATQVTPLITDVNYIYTQFPTSLTLAPGENNQVRIHLEPARRDTVNQTIALQFAAAEGVSGTHSVSIPALTIANNSGNLTMKLAAILILLIAIVAVMAKTQNKI
ncbi:MAG: hypothetical protein Q8R15_04805, partial [Candidatus Micrarchaeota archaeon]|nr:hypothetical protein [Candidatus Micrarchaeota archaeon]